MNNDNRSGNRSQQLVTSNSKEISANQFLELLSGKELSETIDNYAAESRSCDFTTHQTLAMFIKQVLSDDSSCRNAVNNMNIERIARSDEVLSSSTGAYCIARQRLNAEMLEELVKKSGELASAGAPTKWHWNGKRTVLVDGTTVTLPDTSANQDEFPQHGQQKEGVGFPLARLVILTCLSTGVVLNMGVDAYKGKGTGENGIFRRLFDSLCEGDLLIGDSYYASFFVIAEMLRRGVDVLIEQHGARHTDFRRGERLGKRDHRVDWEKPQRPNWMTPEEYARYPEKITIREAKVRSKILVTTLDCPKKALYTLYASRWHIEVDIRNLKTTMGMDTLSCKTPAMCKKELWIYMLANNLIRILMAQAALEKDTKPRNISYRHTIQIWLGAVSANVLGQPEKMAVIIKIIGDITVGNRPNRTEPRAVKRRPKSHPRLQRSRNEVRKKNRANRGGTRAVA